jgi:hypothetical protein
MPKPRLKRNITLIRLAALPCCQLISESETTGLLKITLMVMAIGPPSKAVPLMRRYITLSIPESNRMAAGILTVSDHPMFPLFIDPPLLS